MQGMQLGSLTHFWDINVKQIVHLYTYRQATTQYTNFFSLGVTTASAHIGPVWARNVYWMTNVTLTAPSRAVTSNVGGIGPPPLTAKGWVRNALRAMMGRVWILWSSSRFRLWTTIWTTRKIVQKKSIGCAACNFGTNSGQCSQASGNFLSHSVIHYELETNVCIFPSAMSPTFAYFPLLDPSSCIQNCKRNFTK